MFIDSENLEEYICVAALVMCGHDISEKLKSAFIIDVTNINFLLKVKTKIAGKTKNYFPYSKLK